MSEVEKHYRALLESLLEQAGMPAELPVIPRGGLDNLDSYAQADGMLANQYMSGLDWGCLICGKELHQPEGPGRPRRTCSDTCRQRLRRMRQHARLAEAS